MVQSFVTAGFASIAWLPAPDGTLYVAARPTPQGPGGCCRRYAFSRFRRMGTPGNRHHPGLGAQMAYKVLLERDADGTLYATIGQATFSIEPGGAVTRLPEQAIAGPSRRSCDS